MDNLDVELKKFFSQDITVPQKCTYALKNALYEKRRVPIFSRLKLANVLTAICLCVVTTSGIVFAKEIKEAIKYFFNASEGMDTAIDNGYIEEPEMEYIESKGTKIKVENMLMDDFNLSFTFSIKLDEKEMKASEIMSMEFPDMIITDEGNRILHCNDKETFDQYCKENDLPYTFGESNENYVNTGINCYIKTKEDDIIEVVYNIYGGKFPKSKKLFINLSKINCPKKEGAEKEYTFIGNWKMKIDVPEKFYNRSATVYTVKYCSDPTLKITDATVYNTGMRFGFETNVKPIYDESDSTEIQDKKFAEFDEWYYKKMVEEDKNMINNEYLENEKGEKFRGIASSSEDSASQYTVEGEFWHFETFGLTKYDMTDKLTVHFNILLPYESRDVVVELERNS